MEQNQTPSSVSSDASKSTSTRRTIARNVYQRKVRISMTRAQAVLAEEIFLRVASNPQLLAELTNCRYTQATGVKRAKRLWDMTHRAIERRDKAMRSKMYIAEAASESESEDQPLVELEGLV